MSPVVTDTGETKLKTDLRIAMSNSGTNTRQFFDINQDGPNIYDAWVLIYSTNGKPAQYWRHPKSGLPRFYDSETVAMTAGGKQIRESGLKGEVAMRPVMVKIFVARVEDLVGPDV